MRVLNAFEIDLVSGGKRIDYSTGAANGAALGAAAAGMRRVVAGDMIARATARGGALGLSFTLGWNVGTHLYNNTRVGTWVNKGIDRVTGLDRVGRDNGNGGGSSSSGTTGVWDRDR